MPRGDYNQKKFLLPIFFGLLFAERLSAGTIYAPTSTYRLSQKGILQPALEFGQGGVRTQGIVGGARSGGSAVGLSAAFPFSHESDSKRLSGWSWGLAGGLSESSYLREELFSPGLYYYEAMLGRGTTFPALERNTGMRGFLEFGIRNDRSRSEDKNAPTFQELGRVFPRHRYSLAVRMGATQALEGTGPVEQMPAKISYRLVYSFYWPLSNQVPAMTLNTGALIRCGIPGLACGLMADFMHLWPNKKRDSKATLDLRDYFAVGPALRLHLGKRYALNGQVYWNFHYGAAGTASSKMHHSVSSKSPSGELDMSIAF